MSLVFAYHRRDGLFFQGLFNKVMAIQPLPFYRKKKLAGTNRPRVDRIRLSLLLRNKLSPRGDKLCNLGKLQPHALAPAFAAPHSKPASLNAPRATSKSSNGAEPSRM